MENTVDVSPSGGFIFEDRDRADNSKLINVSGSISFSVVSDPQQRPIYEAAGKLFLYRNQTFEFVRTSSSYGWQIAPGGAIKTLLTFFHQSTRLPLCPDIPYDFGFGCGERNLETKTNHSLPGDFFDTVGEVRWRPIPNYFHHFKCRKCA